METAFADPGIQLAIRGARWPGALRYPGFVAVDWKGVVVPAGTPAEVVQRLNAAVAKALAQPELLAKLTNEGSSPMHGNPQEVAAYVRAEQAKWGALVHQANLRFE